MNDYNWKDDSYKCWLENLHWLRLINGRDTFKSLFEMYVLESWGAIP